MYDDTFVSLSRWVRMQPPMLWAWNRFRSCKYASEKEDFKLGIIQCVTGDEKLGNSSSVQNVCVFVALLWCFLTHCFASLIDSKILNSMIFPEMQRGDVSLLFLPTDDPLCLFQSRFKKEVPGNYLKIKTRRKQYQNPCFSTSKSH